MRRPRLVASDLDGTLLRPDYTVSDRTRRALLTAREDGAVVALLTGRPPRWTHEVVAETGVAGPIVCANGAITYDPERNVIVDEQTLDPETATAIVGALRKELPGIEFAFEMGLRFGRESSWQQLHTSPEEIVVDDGLELASRPLSKLLARHAECDAARLARAVSAAVGDRAVATWSTDRMLEVSGAGVTKASALAAIAERHHISAEEAVAFGDMPNDTAMLLWAGLGVAVANAHPEVAAVADMVTASNVDDGVALVIERLFAAGTG